MKELLSRDEMWDMVGDCFPFGCFLQKNGRILKTLMLRDKLGLRGEELVSNWIIADREYGQTRLKDS